MQYEFIPLQVCRSEIRHLYHWAGDTTEWQKEKREIEVEMVGWYHRFNGYDLGQTSEDGEGQGSLVCCSPWGLKE